MSIFKTARQNIRRSPYQAIAAVFVVMQTIFIVSIFTFFIVGSSKTIAYFESVPQVSAFFRNDAKESDIKMLEQELRNTKKVSSIKFISHQEAFKIYKERFKQDDPILLEVVTPEVLPRSFDVSAIKIDDLASISELLKNSKIVETVVFAKDVVSNLRAWTSFLRKIGIALILALGIDSTLLIIVIISIKISQKKEDIEIMRLIGATGWYIGMPFFFEGMFYGLIGALAGWAIASGVLWYTTPFLSYFLRDIPIMPIVTPIFLLELLGGEMILALILGGFASLMAVLRYLK